MACICVETSFFFCPILRSTRDNNFVFVMGTEVRIYIYIYIYIYTYLLQCPYTHTNYIYCVYMNCRPVILRWYICTRSPWSNPIVSELLVVYLRSDFCCGRDDNGSGDVDDDDDSRLTFYATFLSHMPLRTVWHFIWYM